jgi:Domain of unknown function (DUF222)
MDVVEIDELSGSELLDHVADLAETQRRCEVEILRAAVQHAYLNHADAPDADVSAKPGREKARQIGGAGTPEVTEFAAAELGARLGLSTISAGMLMADGLDLRHRLPQLWRRIDDGEVRVYLARLVARRTRDLTPEQAAYVDSRVAPYADGRLTWTRFQALVDGTVAAADPVATAEAEQKAAEQQVARPTRAGDDDHGMRGFYIRAAAPVITLLDATLDRLAHHLADHGDDDPVEQRRVKALVLLCRPDVASTSANDETTTARRREIDWKALLPRVVVYAHLYAGTDSDGIARLEGAGPVTETWVRDHLSPHAKVTIRPVLDIPGMAPVDSYEIPERHRQAVHLMTPADTFPYSTSLHPDQLDHTEPYQRGPDAVGTGQSRLGNYGPMSTSHHRLKTHGRWTVKQPFPGIYLWRDPYGATYLVDHTGTRALPRAA